MVGLYLAEGHATPERLHWSFHPEREQHLVDEVAAYWLRHGARVRDFHLATTHEVRVRSRLASAWWTQVLGLGRTSYEQRLPDLIWDRPLADKWALLSGLFEGRRLVVADNGGPSCIIELGTVSDELADGVLRLLRRGRHRRVAAHGSCSEVDKDTHWIRVSGAEQVEQAIALVPERDRAGVLASVARQASGSRRPARGDSTTAPAWVRVTSTKRGPFAGAVYSFEVPGRTDFRHQRRR